MFSKGGELSAQMHRQICTKLHNSIIQVNLTISKSKGKEKIPELSEFDISKRHPNVMYMFNFLKTYFYSTCVVKLFILKTG